MSHDLPPLNALRAFEATARLNSVSQAAEQLHVTHGAVSRQLKVLEEHLGVSLFVKDGRGLKLTDAGVRLRDASAEAFERLRDVCAELTQASADAPFVLGCSGSLLARWLIPRLGRLNADLPDLRLHLSAGEGDLDGTGIGKLRQPGYAQHEAAFAGEEQAAALEAAFVAGGVALLLRHALTEPGIGDPPGYRLDDCRSQRNLSAEGRAQARALGGEAFGGLVPAMAGGQHVAQLDVHGMGRQRRKAGHGDKRAADQGAKRLGSVGHGITPDAK